VYNPRQTAGYNRGEGRPRWASYLGDASFLLLLPFAVLGAVWLRRRRSRLWLLLAPVGLVLLSAAAFYGTPRFRAPMEPVVVVLGAIGTTSLLGRRWPRWAPDVASLSDSHPLGADAS
jgi:asparagine N-glycosylation enzyme membrane subunit Stt3